MKTVTLEFDDPTNLQRYGKSTLLLRLDTAGEWHVVQETVVRQQDRPRSSFPLLHK